MPKTTPTFFEFDDYTLIPKERLLYRRGETLNVKGKDFDVLVFLVENAGTLISKEEFLDEVWPDESVEEGNVTTCISKLRKALNDDSKNPEFIKVIPGHGYRFLKEVKNRYSSFSKRDTEEPSEADDATSFESKAVLEDTKRMAKRRPNSQRFMWRGFTYALTSIAALFAGYWMQLEPAEIDDYLILAIPSITSIFFFMCYAERFPPPDLENTEVEITVRYDAIRNYALVAFLLIVIALIPTYFLPYNFSFSLVLSLLVLGGLHVSYGIFLFRDKNAKTLPSIRHQLVWPVILLIGFSLYFGLSFHALSDSSIALVPIALVLILFFLTRNLSKTKFLVVSLAYFLLLTIAATLASEYWIVARDLLLMQFCIIVSAYLAVFESWKITSDIARKEQNVVLMDQDKAELYSLGALTALMLSIWALPFFFIFSQYGSLFLAFFGVHAFFAFVIWIYLGRGEKLKFKHWGYGKIVAGLTFILLLVMVTIQNSLPNQDSGITIANWGAFFFIFVLSILIALPLIFRLRDEKVAVVFSDRINFTRALSLMASLTCLILLFLSDVFEKGTLFQAKAQLAFAFYFVSACLCIIASVINFFSKPGFGKAILSSFVGFLILSRVVTTMLISLAVFLPSVYVGNSLLDSSYFALPFLLSAIGGFSLNDYFDVDKDLINKPYRAIPSGRISKQFVLLFSMLSIGFGIGTAIFVSMTGFQLTVYLFCIAGVATYNVFVTYLSLTKTFLTSAVSSLPILFSVVVFDYPSAFLFLPIAASCFVLGREWLMDIRDIDGDSEGRLVTIPMKLGSSNTAVLGFGLQLLGALLLLPLVFFERSAISITLFLLIIASVAVLIPLWSIRSGMFQRRAIQMLWLPMFLGLLFFAV
ncbi:MAG: hypothetical protein DWQ47_11960 [Acidobacteria bacterium]|nr:MAG: hypothetical protein DWQ32_14375 [Acidobacteriota bacterium]REJ98286.1 MAG: hypothetical protein DWQ38_17175 [Acidobacteriota bacterium]REK17030.1 MAG: hypothetical protein DWQ43_02220 [Acidobacteriota bacterium]REK42940.1 MAG: hypothetical protein DWQ47_11960 [Acidobacteriota bacterium]